MCGIKDKALDIIAIFLTMLKFNQIILYREWRIGNTRHKGAVIKKEPSFYKIFISMC